MENKYTHIRIEKIRMLYKNSLVPVVLSAVGGFFLASALWSSANRDHLRVWLAITIVLAIIRVILLMRFKQQYPQGQAVLKWEAPYSASMLLVFLSWSVGLIWIMPRDNLAAVFIINTFSIGLAAAAMSWYSALRYLQLASITLALVPMIIVVLGLGYQESLWVGIASACMYASCMMTSMFYQKTFNGNLELAYDLNEAKVSAEHMARTDALTGLNNRRAFFDKAQVLFDFCIRNNQPISALMLDLDHFKNINDTYGHASGDIALSSLSQLLKDNLRDSDLPCRFGGEEFAILLPNTSALRAEVLANQLRSRMIADSIVLPCESVLSLTASFGVADIGQTLEDLLSHADKAMYDAKHNGRNQVIRYEA